MSPSADPGDWARRFGLAVTPLFEQEVPPAPGSHSILLDGANGTFAMSMSDEELWRSNQPADWIWSSDVPHHVTVTPTKVAVLRWDRPADARVFERGSIERNLDRFYGFLTEDRLRSNRSVVDHLLGFFRRLRSLGHAAGLPDLRSTDLFTAALARLIAGRGATLSASDYGLADDAETLLSGLDQRGLDAAIDDVTQGAKTLSWLRLHPSLAVRHAGGQLFQEAHFELLRGATDFDLFGLVGISKVDPVSRGGTHFTPATLARSLVERALESLAEPVERRRELTLCDPACGSGAFLHEALRALRRAGFTGRLRLVGYDISPAAISMARFAVAASLRDWQPAGGVALDFQVADSLGERGMPSADVIVMNPPFIGYATQTSEQRDQLTTVLGSVAAGRSDYSMAFVLRALEALNPGGVLGTLFPASLLSLKSSLGWRHRLLDLADLRFLGSIGDFGLFSHALVQVAAAVLSKGHTPNQELIALITENDPRATSVALRHLRRLGAEASHVPVIGDAWTLFPVPVSTLKERPTWRLPTPKAERILQVLSHSGLPTVSGVFDVVHGIQTGLNSALLLTAEEYSRLPVKERRYFRQATMTDSIQNGRIVRPYWLFYPHGANGPLFPDEDSVKQAVPRYFSQFLEPNRTKLQSRNTIVEPRRVDWWGLARARDWSSRGRPRIITKFFGGEGAFVGDYEAAYLAVMGHVWMLKARTNSNAADTDDGAATELLSERDLLDAYVGICNSAVFVKLLELYAPHVSGGQFDLSVRYVAPIPIPDLQLLSLDPMRGRVVRVLSALGRYVDVGSAEWRRNAAEAAADLYGGVDLEAL
jgi:methylase of polypeptide subunit release factors